ncbi:hypothetical protein ACFU5O_37430 [Streptomyces sp. NPDC057445]|uniref:hypothetical protein n=1 Tax=Streptomyces sp. NPDC057445 TaxID=3346136 RepID=UPI003692F830
MGIQDELVACAGPGRRVRWAFGPHSPVPAWVRAEFDGRLEGCDLLYGRSLGYVSEPLDWQRLHAAYATRGFTVSAPQGRPDLVTVCWARDLARSAGGSPVMVVHMDLVVDEDHLTGLEVSVRALVPDTGAEPGDEVLGELCALFGEPQYLPGLHLAELDCGPPMPAGMGWLDHIPSVPVGMDGFVHWSW